MENLEIRRDVFLKFSIPITLTEGKIGRISLKVQEIIFFKLEYCLKMPAFYKSNPSHMIIENVELTVRSLSEDPNQQWNEKSGNENDDIERKEEFLQISVI